MTCTTLCRVLLAGEMKDISNLYSEKGAVELLKCSPSNPPSKPLVQYKGYLLSYYKKDSMTLDDKLSIAPSSEFINLILVKQDSMQREREGSLELDSIVMPGSQFILVEGPAGMGKSTLCWELCRKWDDLKSLQHYKIVVLQKLREMRLQKATTLNEIFYHDNPALSNGVVDEMYRCEGEGVLLILDGFDEMPDKLIRDKESLIMRVISGACLPKATRLVTSRPSALHYIKRYFPREYRHIETLGFTDKSKERFAEKAFSTDLEVLEHFKKFILSNPIIQSMMYIPVNCAILAQVYKDIMKSSKLVPKTMTQLYTTLVLVLIKRHMIERGEWDEYSRMPSDLRELPQELTTALKEICMLAYRGLFKEQLQLVFTDNEVGKSFQHLGLLNEAKEMYMCEGARTSYSFSHLSIQEFLAAQCVAYHPHDLLKPALQNNAQPTQPLPFESTSSMNFLKFLCGHIKGSHEVCLWEQILNTIIYDSEHISGIMCCCLYEAQNFQNFSFLAMECDLHLLSSVTLKTPLDTYALGYCLVHLPLSYRVDPETSLDMLWSSLDDHTSGNEFIGSIRSLTMDLRRLPVTVAEFAQLALHFNKYHRLLENIKVTNIEEKYIEALTELIPGLCHCQSISLSFHGVCEHDFLVYQNMLNFMKLEELCISCNGCSRKGALELSRVISLSSVLKKLTLNYYPLSYHPILKINPFTSYSVVDAALNSPTLEILDTNFAFQFTTIKNVQTIIIDIVINRIMSGTISHGIELRRILPSLLFHFHSNHRTSPLKLVELYVSGYDDCQFMVPEFVAIVNQLLNHCSRQDREPFLTLHRLGHCCVSRLLSSMAFYRSFVFSRHRELQLEHILQSDSSCSLKRWQSLGELRPLPKHHLDTRHIREIRQKKLKGASWSCPNLLKLQTLNGIHPEMFKALRCHHLYLRGKKNRYCRKKRKEQKLYHKRAYNPEGSIDEASSSDEDSDSDDSCFSWNFTDINISTSTLHDKIVHSRELPSALEAEQLSK